MAECSEKNIERSTSIYVHDEPAVISEGAAVPASKLLLAMLVDRLDCFVEAYHHCNDPEHREIFFEADDWIYGSEEEEHFFSFSSTCRELKLDPLKLQLGLLNVTLSKKFIWKKVGAPVEQ